VTRALAARHPLDHALAVVLTDVRTVHQLHGAGKASPAAAAFVF